jgi:hypothetical protein
MVICGPLTIAVCRAVIVKGALQAYSGTQNKSPIIQQERLSMVTPH